jgi:glutamate formiminotransferase/formiminotetrahydrofolate cyclodeaminase
MLIHIAVKSMGLDELGPFHAEKRIIEYLLEDNSTRPLIGMKLDAFADLTASESPAPGGGSIAAYAGALGAALGSMVANLSASKKGWEDKWSFYSDYAVQLQSLKKELLLLVDEDTQAFNKVMDAFKLPKATTEEKELRKEAIRVATNYAMEVPTKVMRTANKCMPLLLKMAEVGNPNSVSDAGVGALCARTAVSGAYLNVKINAPGVDDKQWCEKILSEAAAIEKSALEMEKQILAITEKVIAGN